jgi:Na+/H+ antiporter NhaD/arsenite permease-like protein
MNQKQESTAGIIAALFVLFTALIAPPVSAALAVLLLVAYAIYKRWQSSQSANQTEKNERHNH